MPRTTPSRGHPATPHEKASPAAILCTCARMRLRHAGVARRIALLPHDEPLREASDFDIPSDLFIYIPDARLKCLSSDVPTMVACYMGLEDPLLVEHRAYVYKDRDTTRGEPLSLCGFVWPLAFALYGIGARALCAPRRDRGCSTPSFSTRPLSHWRALRAATTGRHQGDSGGQASGGGAARSRDRRTCLLSRH